MGGLKTCNDNRSDVDIVNANMNVLVPSLNTIRCEIN